MTRFPPNDDTGISTLPAGRPWAALSSICWFWLVLLLSPVPAAQAQTRCTGLNDSLGYPVNRLITYLGLDMCAEDGFLYTCTNRGWQRSSELCGSGATRTWYVDDLPSGIGDGSPSNPFRRVQDALDAARDGDRVFIRNGTYQADPRAYTDPTCGNCSDPAQPQQATVGFYAVGKSLIVEGESRDGVVLDTGAKYGFVFEHAGTSILRSLTLTGGTRGGVPDTTDAALLGRYSFLLAKDLKIENNLEIVGDGSPAADVGIVGIAGREGAALTVEDCLIRNNSWDGIALYRGDSLGNRATASIHDNVITEGPPGRGAGIGLTWDSAAIARGNEISRYVKGVVAVGNSISELTNNVIRDGGGWGIGAAGSATVTATNNVFEGMFFGTFLFSGAPAVTLRNNVYYGNDVGVAWFPGLRRPLFYNDVYGNGIDLGECLDTDPNACTPQSSAPGDVGNLAQDPQFNDPAADDFTLTCTSPARDAGDPAPSYDDVDGSRNDMGAYGGPHGEALACDTSLADLSPTAIVFDPGALVPGNAVLFDSGVRNLGEADSGDFNVRWLVDGQDVGAYGGHESVPAGATVLDGNSQFLWTATAGNHSIAFLLDVDGHVDEDNESDNSTSVTVSTQPCIVPADDTIVVSDAVVCPGTYNVVDANEDGILRTFASGVTVNFAGATLAGSGTGYGVVAQNVSGVTLLGGSSGAIRGFRSAVLLTDGANHLVEGLDLSNNRKRPLQHTVADFLAVWPDWDEQVTRDQIGNGVVLLRVTDSTIRGNVMRNQQNGIGLFESHRVLIENNNCSDNQGWGLHLHRSSDNTVRDNVADNNHLAASTYCHDVQQDGCDTAAILVIKDSNDNLVEGNSLRNSGDGVFSGAQESAVHWGADRNRYVDNDVSLAKHIGIESTFSDANELLGNLIQGCGRYGVWLGYSKNATIADNTITGNAIAGIANESAQSIEVRDNAIDGNGTGVLLWRGSFPFVDQDSQDYVFTGNSVSENSGLGLSLVDTHRVTVADNTIADNAAGNLFLGSELESEIQGPIAVHQNNILGLSLPYNVSSDCCDFDCGVCDGQVDCCNSLPGCAYYLCSNQCHPEGTSNCDAGCSEFCSASAAPFASPGIGPSPGGGLPELAVSTPAPYTPAGPAAKATEAECRVCDGDVGCCDATEGCAYYFCSRQCHPVGTSNCAAGCTAQCDCRANDGDVNACNAAEGCAYYLCSDQCHPEGTSNCDAGCPEFCGPGACRVNDGDVNACNATAGCAYYLCSDQCHPVGTSNCDAGCPEFCAPDPCRANDGDVNACNATMGCAYYNCSDQCHPVGTSNCDAGCTEFCTGDGFCGWDEIVDLSENWWGTNDFGVIGSKICGDIPFLPILFGPAF